MNKDKNHGKGGSYVRLPDGTRVTAAEAKLRAAQARARMEAKPVEDKPAEKKVDLK